MPTIFVQFLDSTENSIISVFSCPQDDTVYPNQGVVDPSDERYIYFIHPELRPLSNDELAVQARANRDVLIAETDYLLMPDYPISAEKLEPIKVYRQALRDITIQTDFPNVINWPIKP